MLIRIVRIRPHERGLLFRQGAFEGVLDPGWHAYAGLGLRIDRMSVREPRILHPQLDVILRDGGLGDQAEFLDLLDHQRALVWFDGRLHDLLGPGLHALWTVFGEVRTEIIDARELPFRHTDLATILEQATRDTLIERVTVDAGHAGLLFRDGQHVETLPPGTYALWRGLGRDRVWHLDLRLQTLDVAGQEIITGDKVTLRINSTVSYRINDPLVALTATEDHTQTLYREAQLALRAIIGGRELDALLVDKEAVADELDQRLRQRTKGLGIAVDSVGIKDVILPGEMRTLMNRVTEARKAAEANLIARREETAAMRSQANTARILESSPTLMKLRELEVLEKVADNSNLSIMLTETGLAERVTKLI